MKKILAILLAGLVTATAFAGCGSSDSSSSSASGGSGSATSGGGGSDEKEYDLMDPSWPEAKFGDEKDVTLKVWAPDAAVDLTKKQVAAFKEHYSDSGVNFNIEVVPQGENEAATQIVTDKEAAADVFGFPSDQMTNLMSSQVLTKVNPKFAYSIKKYCAENPVNAATKTVDGEENLYAFPETNDNGYYLVYDKSIVKDPTKLESILADCRAAGRTFVMDSGNGFYSCVFMFTGGAIIDGLDNGTQKFKDYKEEDVVKTLMAFAKLMKTYKGTFESNDVASISTGFTNKKVGAGIDGAWDTAANKKALGNNLGAAKLPTIKVGDEDKQMVGLFGYKYIGINSATKYPRTATILAYYLAGKECQVQRAKDLGWGPANTEAMDEVADDPVLAALKEQSKPENSVPQVDIATTFWSACGTLGSDMYKDSWNPDDEKATKELFNKVMGNILDK